MSIEKVLKDLEDFFDKKDKKLNELTNKELIYELSKIHVLHAGLYVREIRLRSDYLKETELTQKQIDSLKIDHYAFGSSQDEGLVIKQVSIRLLFDAVGWYSSRLIEEVSRRLGIKKSNFLKISRKAYDENLNFKFPI